MGVSSKCVAISVLVISVLIVSIVLISSSLKKLKTSEVGIEYDTEKEKFGGVKGAGLHAGPPFFKFLKYSAVYITRTISTTCISKDGMILPLVCSFQYLPDRNSIEEISKRYRNAKEFDGVIMAAAKSALNHGCGDFVIEEFQSRRLEVQERQMQYLEKILKGRNGQQALMATVIDLQLENVDPPSRWEDAVEDKQNAMEDIRLAENERKQALTAASTRLKVTQEQARIVQDDATTTVDIMLTRSRAKAEALLSMFEKLANQTKLAMDTLDLNAEDVSRYLLNRQIEAKSNVVMSLKQPATTPHDEL